MAKKNLTYNAIFFAIAGLFYATIFSASLEWSRVFYIFGFDFSFEVSPIFNQVRSFLLLLYVVCTAIFSYSLHNINNERLIQGIRIKKIAIFTVAIVFLNILYYASFRSGVQSPYAEAISWDFLFSSLLFVVFFVCYYYLGIRFIYWFLIVSVIGSFASAIFATLSPAPEFQRPLASTYTFYRISIFGGFSAICLAWIHREKLLSIFLWAVAATLCFSFSYISLSKAALVSGVFGLGLLSFIYMLQKKYLFSSACIFISIFSVILFWQLSGSSFVNRFESGMLNPVVPIATQIEREILALENQNSSSKLSSAPNPSARIGSLDWQSDFVEYFLCKSKSQSCQGHYSRNVKIVVDELLKHHVYLPDYSFRIRLLLIGVEGFYQNPLFGSGFGSYIATTLNRYDGSIEVYSYPHNVLIELLYSVGIVGTTLFLILILLGVYFYVTMPASSVTFPIISLFVSLCVGALFGGDYSDFRLGWISLLLMLMLDEIDVRNLR